MDTDVLDNRWHDIEDSRPKGRNGQPREGSTGYAFLMWKNNSVEVVRILSRTRFGKIRVQRMTPSTTQHEVELADLRSKSEILAYIEINHVDEVKPDIDIVRLPRGIQMKIWGR